MAGESVQNYMNFLSLGVYLKELLVTLTYIVFIEKIENSYSHGKTGTHLDNSIGDTHLHGGIL